MTDPSPLDRTIARLDPADEIACRAFYDQVAHCELHVLLADEASGDQATPRLIASDMGRFVLAFDRAERLSDFAGGVAPSLNLPGKDLCAMLAPLGLGLGLNVDVSDDPYLLAPDIVAWIAGTLAEPQPQEALGRPTALRRPAAVPAGFLEALTSRLSQLPGAAKQAVLSSATYSGANERLLLGVVDADPARQADLTGTVRDAVALLMPERPLDIGFFRGDDPLTAALRRNGLTFDFPEAQQIIPGAPGMDPDRPPRL